jgi:hypothetical protein
MDTTPAPDGLSQNPVDGSWRYACPDHGILRQGLAQAHAINVELKHQREAHASNALETVDLSAAAAYLTQGEHQTVAGLWMALLGTDDTVGAVSQALIWAGAQEPVRAAVVPF